MDGLVAERAETPRLFSGVPGNATGKDPIFVLATPQKWMMMSADPIRAVFLFGAMPRLALPLKAKPFRDL